jgi:dihydroxy-acid dehydratase
MTTVEQGYRSGQWFDGEGMRATGHRARMLQLGISPEEYRGKPIIGILNTWSDINPCHMHLRERAQEVRRGVLEAGGYPLEMPVATLFEAFQKPTAMLYRNLLSIETEEILRSYPLDGAVLMGGCDKTTPGLLMGATSADRPVIYLPAGPMLNGHYKGETLGTGTDRWRFWAEMQAGNMTFEEFTEALEGISRTPGHCMTMGTASTMTSAAEALGTTLPGAASIPAVDSAHHRMAVACGRRVVEMVRENLTISRILTKEAFLDAITTVVALGGSTNALIHLIAMAGRRQIDVSIDDFDRISRHTPVLANIRPVGEHLMEDFFYAGGLRALLAEIGDLLHLDRVTANGRTLGENLAGAVASDERVIRPRSDPFSSEGGIAVLYGNLAPRGAVIKHLAADPALLQHTGPAVVFNDYADMQRRINDPALAMTPDTVLVLRNAGPQGGPGMPEWGMLPIPERLLKQGVRDMVRISDARMSGTSYGTCVLHVTPESFVGGPLALVEDGDLVTLDVKGRRIDLEVSEEELERRRSRWVAPGPRFDRGYGSLYTEHVSQADEGCDFDFLARGGRNEEPAAT